MFPLGVPWVITVEDWAEIRRLYLSENLNKRAISRCLGVARKTVDDALATDEPPAYSRVLFQLALTNRQPHPKPNETGLRLPHCPGTDRNGNSHQRVDSPTARGRG